MRGNKLSFFFSGLFLGSAQMCKWNGTYLAKDHCHAIISDQAAQDWLVESLQCRGEDLPTSGGHVLKVVREQDSVVS